VTSEGDTVALTAAVRPTWTTIHAQGEDWPPTYPQVRRDVCALRRGRLRYGHLVGRVLAAILAAVFAGCAGGPSEEAELATAATDPVSTTSGVPDALGFSAPLLGGGELDARNLAGRPVVFWFWSPF
jgi:hypothetical protein